MGRGRDLSGPRGVQEDGAAGPVGPDQARGLRRRRPGLQLRPGHDRDPGPHRLRRRAHGDWRADRHVHPGAGGDVACIKSVARKDGDDYVITGQKMWITNSLQADWMCMLVNTGEGPVHKNKSLIMVPLREGRNGRLTPGIEVARKIRKIGMNSSDTGLIYFDEVRVPQRNLIGAEGQGFIYQMQQFQEERLWAAASCLQSLENCLNATIEWAQERKMFGATLADQQWVQFKLAEMKTELESLRALTYRACELYVQGQDVTEL